MTMKTLTIALAAAVALAAPAVAQTPTPTPSRAARSMDMSKMSPEQMRHHCAMMTSGETQGENQQNKPPMDPKKKAMHDRCKAMMAPAPNSGAPPPKP
jgi:hypothetical protein